MGDLTARRPEHIDDPLPLVGPLLREPPEELRRGRVIASEVSVVMDVPIPLRGRLDQIHETRGGVLIPTDTKCRRRPGVFSADLVQLSSYAMILNHSTDRRWKGREVARHGYIRLVVGEEEFWVRIELLSEVTLTAMWMSLQLQRRSDAA